MKKSMFFNVAKVFALVAVLSLLVVTVFVGCSDDDSNPVDSNSISDYETPKYVFFFIGDGVGSPQINLTEAALADPSFKLSKSLDVSLGSMVMQEFPVAGMATTHAEDRYITGSAAAATALATGQKTTIGTISMTGDYSANIKTMAEMAKEKGMKVGIVSSVSIDHATPACFYAHTESRNNYETIGEHLTQSNFDYFAGGGVRWNKYAGKDISKFTDNAAANGYTYVNSRSAFDALNASSGKVIATLEKFYTSVSASSAALPYTVDLDEQTSQNDKITLSEFTQKGIEVLDNENGFFMMVEGGKVDWACHANDAVSAAHNMVEFDNAIKLAVDFYNEHPEETLIVITGDHECGGLTLGFATTGYETAFDLLKYQTVSYESFTATVQGWAAAGTMTFENALNEVKTAFGLGDDSKGLGLTEYEEDLLEDAFNRSMTGESLHQSQELSVIYGYYDPFTVTVTHILNNKAGIDWTSYSHTGVPVPVFAMGQGQYEFSGYYDNTDVAKKIISIAGLNAE